MILHLSLYREHFIDILAGKKRQEYRRRCPHWDRLLAKSYTTVKFINGYGASRPWLTAGIDKIEKTKEHWIIHLGQISASGNIESSSFPSI